MRRYFAGLLSLTLVLAGCGKTEDNKTAKNDDSGTKVESVKPKGDKGSSETTKVEGWGNVKGQVVWAGDKLPERAPLKVDKDQDACLVKGPLLDQKYVVDKDSKGVEFTVVWLAPAKGALPIKPELKDAKPKKHELDQPTCQFEPHVMAIREGDEIVAKNTAKVPHNINVVGGTLGPNLNQIIAPGKDLDIKDFKASSTPVSVSCTIHGWMKGYIRVFKHPYFAVTDAKGNFEIKDAPAGTWRLIAWQDEGWVNGKDGQEITIKPGDTATAKIELKPGK
jgi:plastocyanin